MNAAMFGVCIRHSRTESVEVRVSLSTHSSPLLPSLPFMLPSCCLRSDVFLQVSLVSHPDSRDFTHRPDGEEDRSEVCHAQSAIVQILHTQRERMREKVSEQGERGTQLHSNAAAAVLVVRTFHRNASTKNHAYASE